MPKASFLISCYNNESTLHATVNSILKQRYKDFEVIWIDDCSTDSSLEKIQSYSDTRIKIFKNEKNMGIAKSLNTAISKSNSPLLFRLDSDDTIHPERLLRQIEYFDENPDVAVLGTYVQIFNSQKKSFFKGPIRNIRIQLELTQHNPITHSSVAINRNAKGAKSFSYDPGYAAEDYETWIQMMIAGATFHTLPHVLTYYRHHSKQLTHLKQNEIKSSALRSRNNLYKIYNSVATEKEFLSFEETQEEIEILSRWKRFSDFELVNYFSEHWAQRAWIHFKKKKDPRYLKHVLNPNLKLQSGKYKDSATKRSASIAKQTLKNKWLGLLNWRRHPDSKCG